MRCQLCLVALSLAVLAFASCRDAAISSRLDLRTEPDDALDFGRAAVGATQTAQVRIDNLSRFDLRVELSADAPFSVEADITVPSGASIPVTVRFSPQSEGDVVGTLRIVADGFERHLVLRGVAVIAECAPSSPCQRAITNVDGTCTIDAQPDGTPCADLCVTGVCLEGTCTGTSVDCDDHDACTIDACAPSVGCVSAPACETSDPCQAATCDPASGCNLAPVADGTPCGATDACATHVCMSGVCTAATLPDGSACATDIPCRPNGTCAQGRCDAGPSQELTVERLAGSSYADLGALIDDKGNVVVRTSGHGIGAYAYGLSSTGTETWTANGMAIVHGDAAYFSVGLHRPPGIYAVDAATGAQRWFIPDTDLVAPGSPSGPGYGIRGSRLGLNSSGDLVLELAVAQTVASGAATCVSAWRVAIDPVTAATTRTPINPCRWPSLFLVSDGAGIEYTFGQEGISAYDASGPLWSISEHWSLLGAAGGYTFVTSNETCHQAGTLRILDGQTGAELIDTKMYPRSVVSDGVRVFVLGWTLKPHAPSAECIQYSSEAFDKPAVAIVELRSRAVVSVPLPASHYALSDLVLTDRGTALFAQSGDYWEDVPGAIFEVDPSGKITSQCVALGDVYDLVLDDERLFINQHWSTSWSLNSVRLPGIRPARHGWINSMGNNGGSESALP